MLFLFRYLSLRYWARHRGGFVLASLGVALGLAVFVSIQVANHSVLAAFAASLDAVTGRANLQIRGGSNGLPESVYVRLQQRNDSRIQAMAPVLSRTLFSPDLKTSLQVQGVDVFAESDLRDYNLNSVADSGAFQSPDGLNRFLTDPHAIAVSPALAKRHKLKAGSRFSLFVGAKRVPFRVVSVLQGAAAEQVFGGDFALLDIAGAQEAFDAVGRLSGIDMVVPEAEVENVRRELQALVPPDARVARPAQRGAEVAGLLSAFQLNLSALSCIAAFVGAFLIYNAVSIAVVRRRGEIGTLRAMGAGRGTLLRLFLLEAALLGAFGSVIGMALGLLLARYTLGAVSTTVSSLYIAVRARELVVPGWLWWGGPLGGIVLAVISAYPAAREAAGIAPREALQRLSLHHATARFAPRMALFGLGLLCVAAILCLPALSGRTPFAGFAASFATLSGFALLTPLCTLWGGKWAQQICGAVFGIEGALAGQYLQRALNRSSLVIAALMVSLAMTIGLGVMVRSFRGTVANWIDTTVAADLYIAPATGFEGDPGPGLPPEVVRFASALPQVRVTETLRGADLTLGRQPVFIAANTLPTLLTGDRKTRFLQTDGGREQAVRDFLEGRAILISERFANLLGFGAGDHVALPTPQGERRFRVAGVFYDYTPNECVLYMPRALYRRIWHDNGVDGVALFLQEGASAQQVKNLLDRKFGARYQLSLVPNSELRASVLNTFDQTFAVTYALQLIAVLVAAIGIFDTLLALLLERGHELATLRALGASQKQIQKMTLIEFGLVGVFAWIIGSVAGLCLAWQMVFVINRQFFGWTIQLSLPPGALWQALALALLAALGAGWLPSRAAARRHIATALQVE